MRSKWNSYTIYKIEIRSMCVSFRNFRIWKYRNHTGLFHHTCFNHQDRIHCLIFYFFSKSIFLDTIKVAASFPFCQTRLQKDGLPEDKRI